MTFGLITDVYLITRQKWQEEVQDKANQAIIPANQLKIPSLNGFLRWALMMNGIKAGIPKFKNKRH